MLLISIQQFAFKKTFLLVGALLCLSSAICFADSLFMSLHATRYDRQLNRIQPRPVSLQERTVERHFCPACQSPDGRFAPDSGWALSGFFVLDPAINWIARRWEDVGDRSHVSVCAYSGSENVAQVFSLRAMN